MAKEKVNSKHVPYFAQRFMELDGGRADGDGRPLPLGSGSMHLVVSFQFYVVVPNPII